MLCVLLVVGCIWLTSSQPIAHADYLTEWFGSVPVLGITVNDYPSPVAALSCVTGGAEVFCVGGLDNRSQTTAMAYTAPLSTLGVGGWARLTSYPTGIAGQSCVTYSGYVYCVGGLQSAETSSSKSEITPAVYFAPLTASGVGGWIRTTDYPFGVYDQSCAVLQGYVYCVGGVSSNSTTMSAVEYARLSPSGVAGWTTASSYPIDVAAESCSSYSTQLYCVGGLNATSVAVETVYHASLNGTELGWSAETNYPTPVAGQSCVIHYPGLYCIGGLDATSYATTSVFFSYLNETRLDWTGSSAYPVDIQGQSCVTYSGQIYCIGGYNGLQILESVYFSSVGSTQTAVMATTTTTAGYVNYTAVARYNLAMDLVLAATACASILIIVFSPPRRISAMREDSPRGSSAE